MSTLQQLHEEQKALIEKLSNLIRNYKADPKIRKKELSYYEKKIDQLNEVWKVFDENDSKIRDDKEFDQAHEYHIDDTYDRAKEIYLKQLETIKNDEKLLREKIGKDENNATKNGTENATSSVQSSVAANLSAMEDLQKKHGY